MIRRRVRILLDEDTMIYPFDVQYACAYVGSDPDHYGKPVYASYFYEYEDEDGEIRQVQKGIKLWKYNDTYEMMSNLGPRDVNGVFIFEKDLLESPDGAVYVVDYDEVGCYNYLEDVDGNMTYAHTVDLTTFEVIGNILQHRNELFV